MRISDWSSDVCSSDLGDMRVEAEAVVDAVARVDVTARGTALGSPEELTIGAGRGAVAPDPREWQAVLGVDEDGQRRAIAVIADIGVMGPQELIACDALARGGPARQAEVGGHGKETGREAGREKGG